MSYHFLYLLLINALCFLLMLLDKKKARKKLWRIPEATLFFIALIGGSLGGTLGMICFSHKTRKPLFCVGFPLLLLLHIGVFLLHRI